MTENTDSSEPEDNPNYDGLIKKEQVIAICNEVLRLKEELKGIIEKENELIQNESGQEAHRALDTYEKEEEAKLDEIKGKLAEQLELMNGLSEVHRGVLNDLRRERTAFKALEKKVSKLMSEEEGK